jgi:segregation and condensation protein B
MTDADWPDNVSFDQVLEAALFVGGPPLSVDSLLEAFPSLTNRDVCQAVHKLQARFRRQRRPYDIHLTDAGYSLRINDAHRRFLAERSQSQRKIKLTRSDLDVLSVVAYRQPIEKADVDQIVSLDCASTLRQLLRRGLITIQQQDGVNRYLTTQRFLDLFGLDSLADVPASDDLQRF